MQKKILASLLMVPMAYSAFANIGVDVPVNKDAWTANGLVGDALKYDDVTSSAETTGPVGVGFISYTRANMPQGTYSLTFTQQDNVNVTVNGSELKNNQFTLDAAGSIEIKISGKDAAQPFKFTGLNLEIVCDFGGIQDALTKTLMDNLYKMSGNVNTAIATVNPDALAANFENAAELDAETKDLNEQVGVGGLNETVGGIRGMIREIREGENADYETAIAIYEKYELWKGIEGNKVAVAMDALIEDVNEHNEAVKTLNDRWNTKLANEQARDKFLEANADLQAKLDALKAKIEEAAAKPAYGEDGKYITDVTADDIVAIQNAITADLEAIKAAYAEEKLPEPIEFTSDNQSIVDQLEALTQKFNTAEADVAAYVAWLSATRDFLATYKGANTAVAALKGVEGYENVPDFYTAQILKDLEDVYNTTVSMFRIKEGVIEGAAGFLAADQNIIKAQTTVINNLVETAKNKVNGQNDYMTYDLEAIATVQTALDEIVAPKGANGEEITAQKAAIQEELDALKQLVEETYGTLDLQVENFSATVQDINKKVKDLAAIAGPLCDLQKMLDDAAAQIKKDYPEIADKFNNTIANIQEAIDGLTLDATEADMQPTKDAINDMLDNAAKLQVIWDKAKAAQTDYKAQIDSFDALLKAKIIVEGNDFDKNAFLSANADYKALTESYAKFLEDYEAAKAADNQECYDKMTALVAGFSLDSIKEQVNVISKAFETAGSEGNVDVVESTLDAVKAAAAVAEGAEPYAGKSEIDKAIENLETGLAQINAELQKAEAWDYTLGGRDLFNTVDEACQTFLEKAAKITETINKLKEFQTIYNGFVADLSALQATIDANTAYNETEGNSTAPATAYWTSVIAQHQKAKDELAKKIEDAYAAYGDTDKNIKALEESLKDEYTKLKAEVDYVQQDIANNESANTALLGISNNIRTSINTEIDALTEQMNYATAQGATDIATKIQGWIDELNDLLINSEDPEDLASIDIEEKNFFAVGEADDNQEALKAKYDAVLAKFKDLQQGYNTELANDIAAWNNAYLGTAWQAAMNDLLDAYKTAIKTYDQYLYGLKNPGYKAFIAETLEDHRGIYKYIDEINNLRDEVSDWVLAQTAAGKLISAAEFKAQATDPNATMKANIEGEVATMEAEVAAKAEEFYNINLPEAQANINNATTTMRNAGVSDDVISEALADQYKNLDNAIQLEDKAKTEEELKYGLEMDLVATYLDAAKVLPDLNAAAQTQWTIDLNAADTTIAELTQQIKDAEFATEEVVNAQKPIFDEAVAAVEALKAAPYSPAEIDTLLGLQDALQAALDKAKGAADAIKASSDTNKANQDAYNDLTAAIADYNSKLAELTQFVNSLAAGEDATLVAPTAAVKDLADFVEANKNDLVSKTTDIDTLKAAIDSSISNAYAQTVHDENELLEEWEGKLKAAYNDAKVNSDIADFDTEYKEVKDYIDGIEIPAAYGDGSSFNADEYLETANELEFNIANYYNELQKLWDKDKNGNDNPNPDPLAAAQAAVNAAADQAAENMQAAYEALQNSENLKTVDAEAYAQFEQDFQDILAQYEKIQGAAAAEGVRLIYNWQDFVADYAALESTIADKAEEVAAAEADAKATAEKWAASDARYAELLKVYEGLEADYNALVATVEGYAITSTSVDAQLADIAEDLETAKANLDAAKAAHNLDADSTLNPSDTDITSAIEAAAFDAAKAYANKGVDEASAANKALNEALQKNVVPEIAKALMAEQSALKAQLEEIENAIAAVDPSDITVTPEENVAALEKLHDDAAAIKARLEAMVEEATENIFVLGDVNLDPDGLVTASDVQLLIQWVGEGKTYEDLYAMSPVIAAAANVAQEPGAAPAINIADITAEINLVMNADYDTPNARTFVQRRAAAQGSINAIALGNGRYAIALNSTQAFVAGQLDIVLPAGSEIVSAEIVGMSHQLYQFSNDGYTRMIVASMSNEELKGDQLLIIEVQGNGAPSIEGAVFTDANANSYSLGDTTVSGIEGIDAENGTAQRIYNAAGQVMRSIQRGINIIRHSDGTTTKELHK